MVESDRPNVSKVLEIGDTASKQYYLSRPCGRVFVPSSRSSILKCCVGAYQNIVMKLIDDRPVRIREGILSWPLFF